MPTQRKQFGKRGLSQQGSSNWSSQNFEQGGAGATQTYAPAGYGAISDGDDSGFSILKAFGFALGMLFSFQGRIGRMEYWGIGIVRFFLMIGAVIAYATTLDTQAGKIDSLTFFAGLVSSGQGLLFLLVFVALTVCLFSLEVRRYHDRDVSGLWVLLLFVPIVGGFYGLWLLIANGFFPGTPGTNRFDTARSQASVFD